MGALANLNLLLDTGDIMFHLQFQVFLLGSEMLWLSPVLLGLLHDDFLQTCYGFCYGFSYLNS